MDKIDRKIISELEKNAREPFLQIAKRLDVSEGTIRKRVNDMVEKGIIRNFTIHVSGNISAIVGIQTNPHVKTKDIVKELRKLNANKIFELTGRFDILCFISAPTMIEANTTLESIRSIDGILHTETFTVLSEE